jgi:anti-sigma regulatory factor (Ser/Thr protein kinase)
MHGAGYRHEALLYASDDEFMAGTLPFVREAVAADEPILVVLGAPRLAALREALNGEAEDVVFADMAEVGENPARIIPAWHRFVADHAGEGRRLRGIGEPIWADRDPAELAECQRHEALLNVAFSDPDFWLLCPYDTSTLEPAVIAEARRNHPHVRDRDAMARSDFPGADVLAAPFDEPLPEPSVPVEVVGIGVGSLAEIRAVVGRHAASAGMSRGRTADLTLAVHELATNSLRHGGGEGTLRVWHEPRAVVCEISDRGRIEEPLAGRVQPPDAAESGRGLWLANQLCELVQIRVFPSGGVVRVHKRLG